MIYSLMPIIFLIAIVCIALEDKIGVNKAAVTILSAITLWGMLYAGADSILGTGKSAAFNAFVKEVPNILNLPVWEQYAKFITEFALLQHLGDVSTTLFFVMSSMVIIDLVDLHGGFEVISHNVTTRNKRKLLWIFSFITFFASAIIDNIATAIVIVAILRKLIANKDDRWIFASMMIIAANAGGSWSPIGDVTTILLWTGGNLTPAVQISQLILPSLVCMIVPLTILTFQFKSGSLIEQVTASQQQTRSFTIRRRQQAVILAIGVLSLALVPVFNELTGLPPFMGVMAGLGILWVYTDLMYKKRDEIEEEDRLNFSNVMHRLDMPTILFFFGILMSVAALNTAGLLQQASSILDKTITDSHFTALILGVCSSFLDNVALVAGAMGMYPIQEDSVAFAQNGFFWIFLAYCCVTGGSILIIGSATGVTVMGMEKITFSYYLKRFTLLALIGYFSGAVVYYLLSIL